MNITSQAEATLLANDRVWSRSDFSN